jgi:hypothetical protein
MAHVVLEASGMDCDKMTLLVRVLYGAPPDAARHAMAMALAIRGIGLHKKRGFDAGLHRVRCQDLQDFIRVRGGSIVKG